MHVIDKLNIYLKSKDNVNAGKVIDEAKVLVYQVEKETSSVRIFLTTLQKSSRDQFWLWQEAEIVRHHNKHEKNTKEKKMLNSGHVCAKKRKSKKRLFEE